MATAKVVLKITMAWWLDPYICVLAFFCAVIGREPDMDKFSRVITRAMKVQVQHQD